MIKLYSVMDDSLISSDIGGLFTSQEEAEAFKEEVVASNIENGMSKEYIRGGRFIRIREIVTDLDSLFKLKEEE